MDGQAAGRESAVLLLTFTEARDHRGKVIIYDLEKDVRYTLTQKWDRSPDELSVRWSEVCNVHNLC